MDLKDDLVPRLLCRLGTVFVLSTVEKYPCSLTVILKRGMSVKSVVGCILSFFVSWLQLPTSSHILILVGLYQ